MSEAAIPNTSREHLPVEQFSWGTLQWLCNAALFPGAQQTIGLCELSPGRHSPLHYHPNCEEVLTVMSGSGRHSYDEKSVEMSAGTTIHIPAGVRHNLTNTGTETLTCLIAFSAGQRETVFLEP